MNEVESSTTKSPDSLRLAAVRTVDRRRLGRGSRRWTVAATIAALFSAVLAFSTSPASAEITHKLVTQITGPSPTAQFATPWSLTFDAAGNLYVADPGHSIVDTFNSSNQPIGQLGSGTLGGGYTRGVAVDDKTGDVYVADSNHDEVFAFKPVGASPESGYQFLSQWKEPPFGNGCCYLYDAVDNHAAGPSDERAGDVYVSSSGGKLYVVKPEGAQGKVVEEIPAIGLGASDGLAVDAASGNVYVAAPGLHAVEVFNDKGEEQPLLALTGSATPQGASFTPTGVAIDDFDKVIYVIDGSAGLVDEFSMEGVWLGQITQTSPGKRLAPRGIAVQEHAGPTQGEVYVSDGGGNVVAVFAAAGVVAAEVTTGAASAVTATSATLSGTVNPAGVPVSECAFEYRVSGELNFAHSVPCTPSPGAGNSPVAVSAALSGLTPRTTYYFRLSATNANTANYGSEATFFTPGAPLAREESSEVAQTEKAGQTTARLRAQVDPAGLETNYRFEYGETTAYGQSVPIGGETLAAGKVFQLVAAEATGLHSGTTYHYRLVAHNEDGTVTSEDQTFSTLPAVLAKAAVSHVTATSATLEAQINPLGSDTTYYIQYGTADCATSPASCTSRPTPPADVGAGESLVEGAPIQLQELQPGTTYHYRIVAQNATGTTEGPDQTFITQTAGVFALPDARAWELVSPPDKHGALLEPIIGKGVTQAAGGGEAITYLATAPTESEPPGNSNHTQVLSARPGADSSWASRDISTPREVANGFQEGGAEEPRFFSSDLSVDVIQPWGAFDPSLSPEASEQTAYLRTNFLGGNPAEPCLGSCYRPLVTGAPGFANVPAGTEFGEGTCHAGEETQHCGPSFEGASPDGSHIVLGSATPLVEGAPADGLYEWIGGRLQLVSVLPVSEGGGPVEGTLGSSVIGSFSRITRSAVSTDGSRVVWSVGERLYVRDVSSLETALLGSNAEFQTASSDGTRVVFTEAGDLKVFEASLGGPLTAGHVTDLIPDANVIGIVPGASKDAASIYFVSDTALRSTPNPRGERAVAGTCTGSKEDAQPPGALCDLYVWHGGHATLVAVISGDDRPVWQAAGDSSGPTARVSPNGEWLAFMSDRPLTGYDNRDVASGAPDEEVFLYGATGEGSLVCASCNPTGARPHGAFDHGTASVVLPGDNQRIWAGRWLAANVPGWTSPLYQTRYLSNSGRLFFNSNDALVPYDTNGGEDVYQYEPPGVGGCTSANATFNPRSGGCVDLISSGTAREGAAFLDASESGDDVFFLTSGQLSPQDPDTLPDVYDARVGGSSPVQQQPPACEGDACQSPASAPSDSTPDSLTYEGPGNLTPQAPPASSKKTVRQTKAAKLSRALGACRRIRSKTRHRACERQARRRYGPARGARTGKATNNRRAK